MTVVQDQARTALLRQGFALEYVTLGWNVAGIVTAGAVDHSAGAAFIREQPVHDAHAAGYQPRKAARSGRYEIICIACGDNPDRDYSDVPAEIQHVRGPYPTVDAARDALRQHLKLLSNR